RQVQRRQLRGQAPVQFLGEGAVAIPGPEPGLEVYERHLAVERREGRGEAGRRISLDENRTGFLTGDHIRHPAESLGRDGLEPLPLGEDVEVVARFDTEQG